MQVLFSGGGAQPPFAGATAKALTNDHKPEDAEEQKRITAAGGKHSMVRDVPAVAAPECTPPLRLLRAAPGGSRRRSTPKGRDRPTTGLPTTTLSLQAYAVAPAGKVSFGRVIAPDGKNFLACARSIGDGRFKTDTPLGAHLRSDLVPATPDVASHALGPEDRFVVLASDGVSRPGCNPMRGRPQPRVLQAATPRAAGCNPTCRGPHPHSP